MLSVLGIVSYYLFCKQGGKEAKWKKAGGYLLKASATLPFVIMSVEDKFHAAVQVIKSLPTDGPYQPSNDTKLKFYSLYKQATEGTCRQAQPGFWDVVGRAKYNSWKKLGEMSKDAAMHSYIDELKKIVETMSFNGDVENFLDSIGPFYEFISLNSPELDNVKETIDRLTSSSSSAGSSPTAYPSSPSTSTQNTPAKTAIEAGTVESANDLPILNGNLQNGVDHSKTNGHIPQNSSPDETLLEPQLVPEPPSTPVHKPSQHGSSVPSYDEDNDIIGVLDDGTVVAAKGSRTSGSERYFSGESDLDYDGTHPEGILRSAEPVAHSSKSMPKKSRKYRSDRVEFNVGPSECATCVSQTKRSESLTVISMTVDRLNRDIDHVLARLRILEAAYASGQAPKSATTTATVSTSSTRTLQGRRGPFRELSRSTWILIFSWPVLVHLVIKLISWYLRRRRNRLSRRAIL